MANLADQYKDARDLNALQATGKGKMPLARKVDQVKKTDVGENKHVPNDKKRFIPKTEHSRVSSSLMTMSSSCQKNSSFNMPLSAGYVNNVPVTVLRDTGCSGIVVKMSKIQEENLIVGKKQTCILADGSKVSVPIADVSIDTPFLKGQYEVWCMENPYPQLRVPDMITEDINPMTIRDAQEHDHSLKKVRENVENNLSQVKKNGKVSWFKKNDLMFRQYSTHVGDREKTYSQLVVPDKFRNQVMKLAHDSLLAGHLGTQRTLARVTSEFWWPGIQSDVRRFCQSCDICQRTVHKGKIKKVPLERMPLIDEPFQRVAVDLVGPLSPITDKGNRYILTLVDYATRYPEAIALPSIETERIAEALFEMFSRIGIPREMLTDMGAQFTSALMSEVSRLISLSQRTTTPYHPSCNGLVERFNGTLKQMLKRLCSEKPKDWDKYLSAVLFAYREVPQESLGFSPFELVYGRSVRGPISILKELWTNDTPDPNVKTTYQYVLDLKDRLQSMAELAKESLEKSSTRYKKHYDRKTRTRSLKVGDKALVLLPTDNNKLLLQWKGPFVVTKKVNRVDYQLDMQGKTKTFHINLLKKYIERPISDVASVTEDTGVLGLVNAAVVDCVDDEDQDGHLDEYPQSQTVLVSQVYLNMKLERQVPNRFMSKSSDTIFNGGNSKQRGG
ncbi:retrovirus-related Pol polyprotein from transposon 412 [Magallana gigas]|uniref:retrovirus-related Pol polyprotein from transposon 412 n=1 Tax=Magallana gigas TaxID=29159 RepID=UPI00333F66FF